MNIFDLSLRHILVFNSVAKTLNMSRSAKELHITQPAVTQTIKDIESKFSTKLFVKKGRNIYLTQEGRDFYLYTQRVVNLLKDAQMCLESFKDLNRGLVRVGASTTIGNYLLPELIKTFNDKYKNIKIITFIGNTRDIIKKLELYDIDLGLIEGLPQSDEGNIKATKFMEDELVFICSSKHPLGERQNISIKEIEHESFISRERGSGTRQIIETELGKMGIHLNVLYEFNNSEAIKNAVLNNLGISVLSKLIVKKEIGSGAIKRINIKDFKISRWFYILEANNYNKAQQEFIQHVKKIGKLMRVEYID